MAGARFAGAFGVGAATLALIALWFVEPCRIKPDGTAPGHVAVHVEKNHPHPTATPP
jgi:hypothetical protein